MWWTRAEFKILLMKQWDLKSQHKTEVVADFYSE